MTTDIRHTNPLLMILVAVVMLASCTTTPQSSAPLTVVPIRAYSPPHQGRVLVQEAIVWENTDSSSRQLARLSSGVIVSVVAEQGDWVSVESVEITDGAGWTLVSFLAVTEIAANSTPTPSSTQATEPPTATPRPAPVAETESSNASLEPRIVAIVTARSLNVRSGPDTTYSKIGSVQQSDELTVVGRVTDCSWLEITTESQIAGWVLAAFVRLDGSCAEIPITMESASLPADTPRPTAPSPALQPPAPPTNTRSVIEATVAPNLRPTVAPNLRPPATPIPTRGVTASPTPVLQAPATPTNTRSRMP